MEYTYTSVKPVVAKIVRDIGKNNLDPGYLDDMLEWIPEAMGELETTHQLVTKSTPNKDCQGAYYTINHAKRLPSGVVYLRAVENEFGQRVRRGTDETDIIHPSTQLHELPYEGRATNFLQDASEIVGGITEDITDTTVPWDGRDIKPAQDNLLNAYYKIQGGCIQTSVESMFIKLHYDCLPTDKEGYPLIPDLHEYREAIYWYVLSKLMAAGFDHKLFKGIQGFNYITSKFEEYASLALGKIKIPDIDRAARLRDAFSLRLVPPYHFYEDFSIGGEQTQDIRLI